MSRNSVAALFGRFPFVESLNQEIENTRGVRSGRDSTRHVDTNLEGSHRFFQQYDTPAAVARRIEDI